SVYLPVLLACLAVTVAELPFLPGLLLFAAPALILLVVAFVVEGRWSLPVWAANLLGVVIAVGWAGWVVFRVLTAQEGWLFMVPMPAALLPDAGLLVLLLLLVKLFRPKKIADVWTIQLLALVEVGLGCVLAWDLLFGALLVAYLLSALWFLAHFHLRREAHQVASGRGPTAVPAQPGRRGWLHLLYGATGRTFGIGVVGLLLFLLLPRASSRAEFNPFSLFTGVRAPPPQTGFAEQMDLNRTGLIEVDDEVVLEVRAEDAAGNPRLDLSGEQRWRGMVLDFYSQGCWLPGGESSPTSNRGQM